MTVTTFTAATFSTTPEAGISVMGAPQPSRQLNLQVWTTVTTSISAASPRGIPTLIAFPGLRHALSVRVYETDEDTAVEDPATGVFGSGADLPAAIQDFQDALQGHLAVLTGADALAPALRRQLDILRGYFSADSEQ
jgi:hypothetical protein